MSDYRQCDVCGYVLPVSKVSHSINIDYSRFWACDNCAGLLIEQLDSKKKLIFKEEQKEKD